MNPAAHPVRPATGILAPPAAAPAAPAVPFAHFRSDLKKAAEKFLGPRARQT